MQWLWNGKIYCCFNVCIAYSWYFWESFGYCWCKNLCGVVVSQKYMEISRLFSGHAAVIIEYQVFAGSFAPSVLCIHSNIILRYERIFSLKQVRVALPSEMMTSSNGNIFRVTGHLCGEFTGPRWIPHTKASGAELWCFLWSASE